MTTITIKKGATFNVSAKRVDLSGTPMDITNTTITSKVVGPTSEDVTTLVVVKTNPTIGEYTITADTSAWLLGSRKWDIWYSDSGDDLPSPSDSNININVIKGVTNAY